MSTAAWADGEIAFTAGNRIGATDNSTAWYGQASEIVAVGPHQRLTLKFKTYTATDAELSASGVTDAWHDQLTHALNIWDGQEQNLFMKGCGWGWKAHGGSINDPADYDVNTAGVFNRKTYGWAADYRTMIGTGADVVMYIERNGSELSISQTFTTSGGDKYYHYFSGTFGLANNDVWLQMTVERAHIDITADKELTDASITGTLISIQNNTGGFKAGDNKDFTIGANKTLNVNFKSFTNKINVWNGWGIEMQYGEDYFDLVPGNKNMWGNLNVSPSTDWGTWPSAESDVKEAMDGATVNLTIARSGATVTVTAVHVTAANVTHTITHSFTPTAADFATSDVTFRFFVEGGHLDLLPVTAAINEYGWATFVSDFDLDFSKAQTGLAAYAVTGHEASAITKDAVTSIVPAGTPLLLNGDASTDYTIPVSLTTGTAPAGNLLKAGTGASVASETGKTKYALSFEGGVACFKKITAAREIPAGKAYLEFNETIEAREFFALDEETTGVADVRVKMADGRSEYFNLAGQRVAQPTRGLYIVNGRKVLVP